MWRGASEVRVENDFDGLVYVATVVNVGAVAMGRRTHLGIADDVVGGHVRPHLSTVPLV